jgi:hypothetical protein
LTYVDPGPDPRFPNRPDHPHFRLLSDLAQASDAESDNEANDNPIEAALAREKIHDASVSYMARNRGAMAAKSLPEPLVSRAQLAGTAWLDGFLIGYQFAVNRPDMP